MIRERIFGQMHAQKTMIYDATVKAMNAVLGEGSEPSAYHLFWEKPPPFREVQENHGSLVANDLEAGVFFTDEVLLTIFVTTDYESIWASDQGVMEVVNKSHGSHKRT